ncbi:MAG TPA: FHA domain-containing protein [Pyrinomonadaceae bacterium]|nr:FHA domain-containing protein [Pyrinomonadaceae bacterium]
MQTQNSTFVVTREDLAQEALTLVTDGLKVGRLPSCELVLNHPTVSRLHAGIKEAGGRFYVFNFSHSSGTTLNGRVVPVEEAEVLADGDVLQIGPFSLHVSRAADALHIRVTLQVAARVGEAEERGEVRDAVVANAPPRAARGAASAEVTNALAVFWSSRRREAGKVERLSPVRPHAPSRVVGKARFNWTPTGDLVRPWPVSIFVWGALVVFALSGVAALAYTSAFSPAPVSDAHARPSLQTTPTIAREANAGSCTTCHAVGARMETRCASCHEAEGFRATVIKPHEEAGVGCVSCHAEHRGADFSPAAAALRTCNECHNDANPKLYRGRRVGTPHGGTLGYPVRGGEWVWAGLDEADWSRRPAEMRQSLARWPAADEGARRSAQFHVLHLHRVRAVDGLAANAAGEVSCSTCHKRFAPDIDRDTPRTTCASCHAGDASETRGTFTGATPDCISCHVQHPQGRKLWGAHLVNDNR